MSAPKEEERKKQHTTRQKESWKRKLDELTAQEWEELRKWNDDWQRAYRERNLKRLDEQRNRFVEQQINGNVEWQRQHSTSIPVKPTVTDAQAVPNTNMVPHKEIEIDDNILVPSK